MMETLGSFVDWISSNKIVSSLVGAAIIGLAGWALKWNRDKRESNRIYQYLVKSAATTAWRFRSTQAISSATHMSKTRVEELCSRDKRIKRNEKEKESWQLV
jgi:hypothetical protein